MKRWAVVRDPKAWVRDREIVVTETGYMLSENAKAASDQIDADALEIVNGCLVFYRRLPGNVAVVRDETVVLRVYAPGDWRSVWLLSEEAL